MGDAAGQERGDHRHPLHVRVRGPLNLAEADLSAEQVGQAQMLGQGGGQDEASIGDQAFASNRTSRLWALLPFEWVMSSGRGGPGGGH
jgi:hypothetical protein